MPRIRPDQLADAIRAEGSGALPISRLCQALARAGDLYDPAGADADVRKSAQSRPDLFFVLEPGAAWRIGTGADAADDPYRHAFGAATGTAEPRVVLLSDGEAGGAPEPAAAPPPIRGVVLRLWDGALDDAAAQAELAGAMHDAVELERIFAAGRTDAS